MTEQSQELVNITVKNHVADVQMRRGDKYNALSPAMFKALIEAGEALAKRSDVRVAVLSGEGPGFCSGLDMSSFMAMESSSDTGTVPNIAQPNVRLGNDPQMSAYVWKQVPVPVIAALHGVAYGGGLQVALGADIRLADPNTRFSIMEIKWGLIPDMSITQTIRDLLPLDVAKELTFTGRIFNAAEAEKLGIITSVTEHPYEAAMVMAQTIAAKNPDAIRRAKQLFEEAWHADTNTGLKLEEKLQLELIGSENQREAIKANLAKREPEFH